MRSLAVRHALDLIWKLNFILVLSTSTIAFAWSMKAVCVLQGATSSDVQVRVYQTSEFDYLIFLDSVAGKCSPWLFASRHLPPCNPDDSLSHNDGSSVLRSSCQCLSNALCDKLHSCRCRRFRVRLATLQLIHGKPRAWMMLWSCALWGHLLARFAADYRNLIAHMNTPSERVFYIYLYPRWFRTNDNCHHIGGALEQFAIDCISSFLPYPEP